MAERLVGIAGRTARYLTRRASMIWIAVIAFFVIVYFTSDSAAGALMFGIASGALVSAIALSVVMTFKGSGVVNFAAGAIGMYVSYVFMDLRTKGDFFIPPLPNPLALIEGIAHKSGADGLDLPSWPTKVSLGGPWSFYPALFFSLLVAAVLGLIFHFGVYRPLRHAPALAKVVASVGLLVVLQAIVIDRFTTTPYSLAPKLPKTGVRLPRNVTVPEDQLISVGVVLALTVILWALFKYTRFGIASRANAENEKSIVLLGHAPNRLAAASWVLSSVLVGFIGILVSTVNTSVDPNTIVLLVVPAVAAALLGGFTSFGITVAAGIAISMGEGLVQNWSLQSWFPHIDNSPLPGIEQAVPFVVIVVVLIARGTAIPTRATASALKMPFAPKPNSARIISLKSLVVLAVAIAVLLTVSPPWRLGVTTTAVSAVLAMSLVVVTGFVGQISLAQLTLAGVAGFALSKFTVNHGMPFPLGPLAAILFATAVGVIVSVLSIRVRGVDLAIVTLAIAVAAEVIVFNNPKLAGSSFGATVPPPKLGPAHFGPSAPTAWSLVGYKGDGKIPNPWFGVFCVIVALLMAALVLNFRRSRSGRISLAVRSNERATASSGVSVTRVKLVAFTVGSFLAGTGGVLAGYSDGAVSTATFGSFASLTLVVYAYLGGISSVGGALCTGVIAGGGLAAVATTQWFHIDSSYLLLLGGVGLVLTVVFNPEGIAGEARRSLERLSRLLRHRVGPITSGATGDVAIAGGVGDRLPASALAGDAVEEVEHSGRNA